LFNGLDSESGGDIAEIADRLQQAAQWWEQLLHATGGQLELPKCFYYLLHWVFDSEGHARLATPEELNIQISLRQSADDQEIDIKQRCFTTSHRTLGVHENPAGNYQTEYKHLLSKGQNMAQLLSAQLITRSDAWTAYRSIYLPSISYGLPSTSFNQRELSKIQSSPIRALLPAMGQWGSTGICCYKSSLGHTPTGASVYDTYTLNRAAKRPPHFYNTSGNTSGNTVDLVK
jgi:hypothetical protein